MITLRFDKTKASQIAQQAVQISGDILRDAGRDVLNGYERDAYEKGRDDQRDLDIRAAIKAILDAKQNNTTLPDLLNAYFDVESISDANQYITDAKVDYQYAALKTFCMKQGMSRSEFLEYADHYSLNEKLETNPKLLDIPVEKLKAAIEKK